MALPRTLLAVATLSSCAALKPSTQLTRRGVAAAAAASLLNAHMPAAPARAAAAAPPPVDYAAKWSLWGLVPPPMQGEWSYEDLLSEVEAGNIATVQIAVQHDCVVATNAEGHRFYSYIKDSEFNDFLLDAMDRTPGGSLPFEVLPMDPLKAKIRDGAWTTMNVMGVLWVADQFGMLPWDSTPYASLEQREEAQRKRREEGEAHEQRVPPAARMLNQLKSMASARSDRTPTAKSGPAEATGALLAHFKAMVMGARTEQEEPAMEAEAEERTLKEKLRPRALERAVLDMRPYELEKTLIARRPHELEKNILAGADAMYARADEIRARLKEVPWVTPQTMDRRLRLPTLQELLSKPWLVSNDGVTAQYIRAHPTPSAPPPGTPMPAGKHSPLVKLALSEGTASGWYAGELGFCRVCPEFSTLYGSKVYICKKLLVPA